MLIRQPSLLPSHDIACSAENLGETGDDDIDVGQHMHVDKGAYCLIMDHCKMMLICKSTDATQVRCRAQGIR